MRLGKWEKLLVAVTILSASPASFGCGTCNPRDPAGSCCLLTWTGSTGGGVVNCPGPTNASLQDKYSVSFYSSQCVFLCSAQPGYDSTITPTSCSTVTSTVVGVTTETSTLSVSFAGRDCTHHNVSISTQAYDPGGFETDYVGFLFWLQCNKDTNGNTCPH